MQASTHITPIEIGELDPNMRASSTWPTPHTLRGVLQEIVGLLFGPRMHVSSRAVAFPGGFKALGSRALAPVHPDAVGFLARRRLATTGLLPGEKE